MLLSTSINLKKIKAHTLSYFIGVDMGTILYFSTWNGLGLFSLLKFFLCVFKNDKKKKGSDDDKF